MVANLTIRTHFSCIYNDAGARRIASSSRSPAVTILNIQSSPALGSNDPPHELPPPTLPSSIWFLDRAFYQRTYSESPIDRGPVPTDLLEYISDIKEQSRSYFKSIHPWLPIISKRIFNERILSRLVPKTLESVLLLCAMKLCNAPSNDINMRSDAYHMVKDALARSTMVGVPSMRLLQTSILLCLYELGHAILPCAHLTIGASAKYASALGLTFDSVGRQTHSDWIDMEEKTRALWAILILDRYRITSQNIIR